MTLYCPICFNNLPGTKDFVHQCNNGSMTTTVERRLHNNVQYTFFYRYQECDACYTSHESDDWDAQVAEIVAELRAEIRRRRSAGPDNPGVS